MYLLRALAFYAVKTIIYAAYAALGAGLGWFAVYVVGLNGSVVIYAALLIMLYPTRAARARLRQRFGKDAVRSGP